MKHDVQAMNRPRPYIPLAVRVQVAERMVRKDDAAIAETFIIFARQHPQAECLGWLLMTLFGEDRAHLDHAPPLRVRPYNPKIKNFAARYTPNANDPAHLIYRTVHDHHIKTQVRGDGAQFPDRVLIKRERRHENPKPKRKYKWASPPLRSRNTLTQRKSKRRTRKLGFRLAAHIRPSQ